jgi:CheY-like chemotaxis protein
MGVAMNSQRFSVGNRGTVILVNEPDAQQQQVLQRLQQRGFRAHVADSGRMALQLARDERPDVILMDMDRPTLDGWESTRRLKADPVTRHILVVALSEDTQTDRRNLAMRVGCDGFEAKPLDVDHLVASVESLLPAQSL